MTAAGATFVFAHRHVADPMQAIFDAPVAAIDLKQQRCTGAPWIQARDRVGHVSCSFAVDDPRSLNADRLSEARPIEIAR